MDLERGRDDLIVAGVAAVCAIVLTVSVTYGFETAIPIYLRLSPLYVYVLYVFTRKGGPYSRFDTPPTWIGLTLLVTVATAVHVI